MHVPYRRLLQRHEFAPNNVGHFKWRQMRNEHIASSCLWYCSPWASCHIRKIACCACAGIAGNVSPPPRDSDTVMHHGTCVTHVPWCMPGSLTSGFLWSRWRGKHFRHSRRIRNPQLYVSGKRPAGYDMLTHNISTFSAYSFATKLCLVITRYYYIVSTHWYRCFLPGGHDPNILKGIIFKEFTNYCWLILSYLFISICIHRWFVIYMLKDIYRW